MNVSRRSFLGTTGAVALGSVLPPAFAQTGPIKLGTVLDNSGNLDIYGKPMVMASTLAVEELNAGGGVLGRKIQAIQYDTQSDIALYTKFAQQLARDDKVDVVHGGITSASREAIRQTFKRANTLYFYNVLYEGGVCDRNIVVSGTTPAQAVEPVVELAMKQWGDKVYIIAADYNYGQITAKWIEYYVKQRKGTTLKTEFFPLDVADFGSTIAKIQQEKPSFVVSALVGGAHMSFYRQWAASGMNKKIPLASTTFGVGNEHLALSAAEGDGILIAGNYSQEAATPANRDFLARWQKRFGDTKIVHEIAVSQYQGILLWAECARKAGSLDREKMGRLAPLRSSPRRTIPRWIST
jgi:urea transport system substrate-binding protein